jgi:serralysin
MDTINGGAGFDTLTGGAGNDLLLGQFNADRFIFSDGHGDDTIGDFDALNDFERIDLRGVSAISNIGDLELAKDGAGAAIQSGTNVIIITGNDSQIVLTDVWLADLDTFDFAF